MIDTCTYRLYIICSRLWYKMYDENDTYLGKLMCNLYGVCTHICSGLNCIWRDSGYTLNECSRFRISGPGCPLHTAITHVISVTGIIVLGLLSSRANCHWNSRELCGSNTLIRWVTAACKGQSGPGALKQTTILNLYHGAQATPSMHACLIYHTHWAYLTLDTFLLIRVIIKLNYIRN